MQEPIVGKRAIHWVTLFILLTGLLLALATSAELALRNIFDPNAYYVRQPEWEIVFRPSPQGTPGISEDAHIKINALGLRGEMPTRASTPRILAIGGSTTEDIMLNDAETWTGRLQARLRQCEPNAWVGNMGKAGSNARHHVLQLEKTLPYLPRIDRVIALVGLNDMLFDADLHHPANLPEGWWEQQAFDYLPPRDPTLIERSALYQTAAKFVRNRGRIFEAETALVRVVEFGAMEESYKERFRRVAAEDFVTEAPPNPDALKAYMNALSRLADVAERHEAKLTLMTQPALWKVDMTAEERSRLYAGGVGSVDDWFKNPHTKWYTSMLMNKLMSSYNVVALDVCRDRGLRCVDLASELPKDAAYYYDDFHFSKAGAAEVGRIVARHLAPNCN
jgi:hypothetical protein